MTLISFGTSQLTAHEIEIPCSAQNDCTKYRREMRIHSIPYIFIRMWTVCVECGLRFYHIINLKY